jgi:hypothetical protein
MTTLTIEQVTALVAQARAAATYTSVDAEGNHYITYNGRNYPVSRYISRIKHQLNDVHHFYLERICAVATYDYAKGVNCFINSQTPSAIRKGVIANNLNIPVDKVNVEIPRVGGGFGGKLLNNISTCLAAFSSSFVAYKTGRPTRALVPLQFDMVTNGGRGQQQQAYIYVGFNDLSDNKVMNSVFYDIITGSAWNLNKPQDVYTNDPEDATIPAFYYVALAYSLAGNFNFFYSYLFGVPNQNQGDFLGLPGGTAINLHNASLARPAMGAVRSFGNMEADFIYVNMLDCVAGELSQKNNPVQVHVSELGYRQQYQGDVSDTSGILSPGQTGLINSYPALWELLRTRYDYENKRSRKCRNYCARKIKSY